MKKFVMKDGSLSETMLKTKEKKIKFFRLPNKLRVYIIEQIIENETQTFSHNKEKNNNK